MNTLSRTAFAATLLLAAVPALAEDAHHPAPAEAPAETTVPAQAAPQPSAPAPGAGAAVPGGMMGKMMDPEHVEGRIAFLRTELKVTDAQQPLWAAAAALRENARASTGTMQQEAAAKGLPASLERREQQLSTRLKVVKR